ATFHSAVLIQHHHRHVFHVVVERITKRDHFDERREEHEEQRQRIAQHHEKFLVKNGVEAAKGKFHIRAGTSSARPSPKHQNPNRKFQINSSFQTDRKSVV